MTETFAATSFGAEGFEKGVVVKCVHDNLAAIAKFTSALIDEVRSASQLSHANVIPVLDTGKEDRAGTATYFVVTEHAHGMDLATFVDRARKKRVTIPNRLVLHIVAEIAKALDHAHRRRRGAIVHAGLSPCDVILTRTGEVKVTDFGHHRAFRAAGFAPHDVRALPYRSPQDLLGYEPTPMSDVFALGALLVEMATLRSGFLSDTPEATRERILSGDLQGNDELEPFLRGVANRLTGPIEARPTACDLYEELVAWAYGQGHRGSAADELAALTGRLQTRMEGGTPAEEASPSLEIPLSPPAEVSEAPRATDLRVVTLLAAAHAGGDEQTEAIAAALVDQGASAVSRDAAEVRAVFGLARSDGRDVEDAITAALHISARFPVVGLGLALDRILCDERGEVVREAELEPRFQSAARLASSDRGGVRVSGALARIATATFEIEVREGAACVVKARRTRPLTKVRFVGRGAILATLGRLFEESRGARRLVVVGGEPGIGKTRLLQELERRVLRSTVNGWSRWLNVPRLDPASAVAALASDLEEGLVIVDDCELLDERSAALLVEQMGPPRTSGLFVACGRTIPAALKDVADAFIEMDRLAPDDVALLTSLLVGARVISPELLALVEERAQGTPLVVEHLLDDLSEAALIKIEGGIARVEGLGSTVPRVPRAFFEGQLARLPRDQRTVVRALAILGQHALPDEVAALGKLGREHADQLAAGLVPSLAAPNTRGIPVLHRSVAEVALEGIAEEERRRLHFDAAQVLLAQPAPTPLELERIASHLEAGGDAAAASARWAAAARAQSSPALRAHDASRCLSLLNVDEEDPTLLIEMVSMVARAADLGQPTASSADLAVACLRRFDGDDQPVEKRVRIRVDAAKICAAEHATAQAYVALDQAYAMSFDRPVLEAVVRREEVRLAASAGDVQRGSAAALRVLETTDRLDVALLADASELLAAAGDDRAEVTLMRAEELLGDDDAARRALLETRRAHVQLLRGEPAAAARSARIAGDLASASDATALFADAKLALGEAYVALGSSERAYGAFTSALEAAATGRHLRLERLARLRLAHLDAIGERGASEGLTALRRLTSATEASGHTVDAALARMLLGKALQRAGEKDEANEAYAAAQTLAIRAGHRGLAAQAKASLSPSEDPR